MIHPERPLFDGDALVALDRRIVAFRNARAAAVRFSEPYWEADDTLAWLRMVRDELMRTGRLHEDAVAFLARPPAAMLLEPPAESMAGIPVMLADLDSDGDSAFAAANDATESIGRGSRQSPAEPVAAR